MGYLLTKKAADSNDKITIDSGKILGAGTVGGGLALGKSFVDKKLRKKFYSDLNFRNAFNADADALANKLIDATGGTKGWLLKNLWKAFPGESHYAPTRLGKLLSRGIGYTAGFKNLKLPGKLKALGLLAAPLAAGGVVDAVID